MAKVTRSRLYRPRLRRARLARYVLQLIKNARDKKELKVTDWSMIVRPVGGEPQITTDKSVDPGAARGAGFGGLAGVVLAGLSGLLGVGAIAAGAAIRRHHGGAEGQRAQRPRPRDDLASDDRGAERADHRRSRLDDADTFEAFMAAEHRVPRCPAEALLRHRSRPDAPGRHRLVHPERRRLRSRRTRRSVRRAVLVSAG